jgi:hypothetical protein
VSTAPPFREQPACVEASTVTTLLALAQLPDAESLPVVQLHPGFDAEPVNWRTERGADGIHRVRTHVGYVGFRVDAKGALESAVTKVGTAVVETRALSSDAFGGAGLPPPEASPSAAPAAATAPAKDSGGG